LRFAVEVRPLNPRLFLALSRSSKTTLVGARRTRETVLQQGVSCAVDLAETQLKARALANRFLRTVLVGWLLEDTQGGEKATLIAAYRGFFISSLINSTI